MFRLAIITILLASSAAASVVKITAKMECRQTVCRVQPLTIAAGVVVGKFKDGNSAVLTNLHVVKGALSIVVSTKNRHLYALVTAKDVENDLALLKIRPLDVKPTCFAPVPRAGAELTVYGFPRNQGYRYTSGLLLDINFVEAVKSIGCFLDHGFSGGPVMHNDKAIGIAMGYRQDVPKQSVFITSDAVCKFLLKADLASSCGCGKETSKLEPEPDKTFSQDIAALAALVKRIEQLQSRKPVDGRDGKDGKNGRDGKDADMSRIEKLEKRKIYVQLVIKTGNGEFVKIGDSEAYAGTEDDPVTLIFSESVLKLED